MVLAALNEGLVYRFFEKPWVPSVIVQEVHGAHALLQAFRKSKSLLLEMRDNLQRGVDSVDELLGQLSMQQDDLGLGLAQELKDILGGLILGRPKELRFRSILPMFAIFEGFSEPRNEQEKTLDAVDVAILKALQRDASMTNQAIGELVGLTPGPTHSRIKRMKEEGIIKGIHADLDWRRSDTRCSAHGGQSRADMRKRRDTFCPKCPTCGTSAS